LGLVDEARALRAHAPEAPLIAVQATLFLGDPASAHRLFSAVAPDLAAPAVADALTTPVVLAGARAALLSGDYARARVLYRWVLLRLDDLEQPREEARILIEAATTVSYSSPSQGREARAYLARALAKNAPLLRPIARAAWVLSFVREGNLTRAKDKAGVFEDSWGLVWMFEGNEGAVGKPGESVPVLPPGEARAFAAAVAAAIEPEALPLHLTKYYEQAGPALASHLRFPSKEN
jgi:hypothetical protein